MTGNYRFPRFKAAAVQASPVLKDAPDYFDVQSTLDKAVNLILEAGKNGARLIVFPEGWLPCFCYWSLDFHDAAAFQDIWAKYLWASIEVPGHETEVLCAAAKNAGAYVVIGINERDRQFRGRMYNSILYIGAQGQIMGTHRKICNTTQERFFHTPGDGGDNLKTVFNTEIGNIGGSICSEHSQLTLIYNWIIQGIQVHCSLWPGYSWLKTTTDIRTRAVCSNANVFGVLAATYIADKDKPKNFYHNSLFNVPGSICGGSGIISPSAEYIAGPVYDQETIVYGDIELARIDKSKYPVNLMGIYSRWDLLNLNVRQEPYQPLEPLKEPETVRLEIERISDLEKKVKLLEEQISAFYDNNKSKARG